MIKRLIAATSLLAVGAFVGPLPARAGAAGTDAPRVVLSSSGKVRHVYDNPNACAPSRAIAVWAPGSPQARPLGYRCFDITPIGG